MPQPNDLSRSLVALDQNSTIITVIEMSQSSWLVAGVLPGIERQPRKKLEPNPERLLGLLHRWQDEAVRAGRTVTRIALAFEAGRDGFWLARWLAARGVEAHVIHASSIAVSREHRRAKTDRLDTELLKRGFLGWLRGERGHCSMARVPTIAEEDAKRPNRERDCLVGERTRIALAFEAGRDGFWLARWLEARGVEAHVIHASSVAVSREHRRAKTDRLDTELLKRGFLGWLRGERGHCTMARVPTIAEEDAKRPNRERECLVGERTRIVNRIKSTLARLGIRNFKPTLRKASERLATVHTPEGMPLPPNTLGNLCKSQPQS